MTSRKSVSFGLCALMALACDASAQLLAAAPDLAKDLRAFPVTDEVLKNPNAADWLMYSRTYDAQRFSPLEQINRSNVGTLERAWSKPLRERPARDHPDRLSRRDVSHDARRPRRREPRLGADAATGNLIWEYAPDGMAASRIKALAIYGDMIYYTAPAAAGEPNPCRARCGDGRRCAGNTCVVETHTAGAIVVEGKVSPAAPVTASARIATSRRTMRAAGKEVGASTRRPGRASPATSRGAVRRRSGRRAAAWGLPGSYDPVRRLIYWGISNPMPNTRAIGTAATTTRYRRTAPADLYSNSTVALRPDTGELVWYYQHLPGDDWDMDINQEKHADPHRHRSRIRGS